MWKEENVGRRGREGEEESKMGEGEKKRQGKGKGEENGIKEGRGNKE